MNKQEQIEALRLEIENVIKKWSIDAEKIGVDIVSSVCVEDHEATGCHFMQSINGKASIVVQNLCATLERVPRGLKGQYMSSIVESMMATDEDTEQEFANPTNQDN